MATSFQKVVESTAMQDILCEKLGVDEIDADIKVEIAGETNLLELSVTDDSPQSSFDIMEGILDNYPQYYTVYCR